MDSNSDENKNLSNDVNFDSKNIVRRDNKELFTRVEGAETRAKKEAEERARVEQTKRRFIKRVANNSKRRARKIASAQRRAHLKAVLWEGKNKRRTIIIAIIVLVAAAAYPVYLGGSTLIKNIVASVEEKKEQKEIDELNSDPRNAANNIYEDLLSKYRDEGFEKGEEFFITEFDKLDDDEVKANVLILRATILSNVFELKHINTAIESALKAEEINPTSNSAAKLIDLYFMKNDQTNMKKYQKIYQERVGDSIVGGEG